MNSPKLIGILIGAAVSLLFLFIFCLYQKKENEKMMAFLEAVPQEVKDRLQNTEIKSIPTDPSVWIQETMIYKIQTNESIAKVKVAFFDKRGNKNRFNFLEIHTSAAVVGERNLKPGDIVEIRFDLSQVLVKLL